jgi:transposase
LAVALLKEGALSLGSVTCLSGMSIWDFIQSLAELKLYGGFDLHSANRVVAVTDERDKVVYRERLPNDLGTILSALAPYQEYLDGLVVESTYNWYWLVDGLMAAGYRLHLANTAAIKPYEGLKYSDDDTDACWLAQLLQLGLFDIEKAFA